jgi:hypothetical protein
VKARGKRDRFDQLRVVSSATVIGTTQFACGQDTVQVTSSALAL